MTEHDGQERLQSPTPEQKQLIADKLTFDLSVDTSVDEHGGSYKTFTVNQPDGVRIVTIMDASFYNLPQPGEYTSVEVSSPNLSTLTEGNRTLLSQDNLHIVRQHEGDIEIFKLSRLIQRDSVTGRDDAKDTKQDTDIVPQASFLSFEDAEELISLLSADRLELL